MTITSAFWKDRRLAILAMRAAGRSLAEIAQDLGVTKGQISGQIHTMKRAGIIAEPTLTAAQACNAEIVWTGAMDDTLRSVRSRGLSFNVAVKELGIARATVCKRARELGLPMQLPRIPKPPKAKRARFWTDERHDALVEMARKNMSGPEMAAALGVSRGAVSGQITVLKSLGRINPDDIKAANLRRAKTREYLRAKQRAEAPAIRVQIERVRRSSPINAPADPTAPGSGVSIFDLGSLITQCRWPFCCDDGETRYCGLPATDGSWCAAHGARVFVSNARPSEPRVPGRSLSEEGVCA